MIRIFAAFAACALLSLPAVSAQDADYGQPKPLKCDLKKTYKGWFCEMCYIFPEEDQVDKDGVHKKCKKECKKHEICLKVTYQCPQCYATWPKPGTCKTPTCAKKGVKMTQKEDKARIVYRCGGSCMFQTFDPGKCPTKGCEKKGRRLEKSCEKSGQPPHVDKKK